MYDHKETQIVHIPAVVCQRHFPEILADLFAQPQIQIQQIGIGEKTTSDQPLRNSLTFG